VSQEYYVLRNENIFIGKFNKKTNYVHNRLERFSYFWDCCTSRKWPNSPGRRERYRSFVNSFFMMTWKSHVNFWRSLIVTFVERKTVTLNNLSAGAIFSTSRIVYNDFLSTVDQKIPTISTTPSTVVRRFDRTDSSHEQRFRVLLSGGNRRDNRQCPSTVPDPEHLAPGANKKSFALFSSPSSPSEKSLYLY